MTPESKQARVNALTRLALATREKVEPAVYVVYVEDTQHFGTVVFVEACRRLEKSVAWFPKVAELVEQCRIVNQEYLDQTAKPRQLTEPELSPQKKAEIMARFREVIGRKAMR